MEGECELCGREDRLEEVEIEGSRVLVCQKCSSLGERVSVPSPPFRKRTVREGEAEEMIVEGYGKIIKNAREKLKLTQNELARRMMEKATLISKLEREEIMPTVVLARKLERMLGIKLIERANTIQLEERASSVKDKTVLTLGDLLRTEKEKKKTA